MEIETNAANETLAFAAGVAIDALYGYRKTCYGCCAQLQSLDPVEEIYKLTKDQGQVKYLS